MLTGNLVRVRTTKERVIPLYLRRDDAYWLEVAECLLWVFSEGASRTRGETQEAIDEMFGHDPKTLVQRGLAKVLEDRAEYEIVADVTPEVLRAKVFEAAAEHRKTLRGVGFRAPFRRDEVLSSVAKEFGIEPAQV